MKIYNSKKNLVFCMLTKCLGLAFLHFINSPGHRVHLLQFHRRETKAWRREVIAQGDPESGPRAILPATRGASHLKTLGRKFEFCLESSLPPTCHLINLGCCYIPHFLRGRYIYLLCLNIHLKCISLCKCPLIYIILYKCTNPVIICGFLNALFSFMLGSVSLSLSFPLLHPAFTSDNSCNSCGRILPNFPPFRPTLHRTHIDPHTCGTSVFPLQNGII